MNESFSHLSPMLALRGGIPACSGCMLCCGRAFDAAVAGRLVRCLHIVRRRGGTVRRHQSQQRGSKPKVAARIGVGTRTGAGTGTE